jgi:DNA-binding transcriptional ArsR family regulator/ribosomal protein L31E
MKQKLKLKSSLVIEYLYLLTRISNKDLFQNHPIIQHYRQDSELKETIEEIRKEISPFLKRDLDYFVLNFTGTVSIPLILSLEKGYDSPIEMIDAIEAMDAQAWLQYYFTLNDLKTVMTSCTDQELRAIIEEQIKPSWDLPNRDEEMVIELRKYAEESKGQIVQLYRNFYQKHFKKREAMLQNKLNQILEIHQRFLEDHPKEFMEEILWMKEEYYDQSEDIEFTVTWIGELSHSVSIDENKIMGVYGFGYLQRFDKEFIKLQTMKLFKVLSDERRLEILRMVGKKPRYATELAKELGLTKATVSYHMNLIIEQGLVTIRVEQNRVYYDLNTERLNKQLLDVIKDLAGEE